MNAETLANYISIPVPETWEAACPGAMAAYEPDWLEKLNFTQILDYYEFPKAYYYQCLEAQ